MKTAVDALRYLRECLEHEPEDAVFVYDPEHHRYRQFHRLAQKLHRQGFVVLQMIKAGCFYVQLTERGRQSLAYRLRQQDNACRERSVQLRFQF